MKSLKLETTTIIGKKIRYYRTLRNLTQDELAERIGSTGSYIGRIERGEQNVKLATIEKIATALDLNVFVILNQDIEPLQEYPWIQKIIGLLVEQPEYNQQKAFHILKEVFTNRVE